MVKFTYRYLDLGLHPLNKISGFEMSFGNEEDWNDVFIQFITRGRDIKDSVSFKVSKEWLDKMCNFLREQTQLKSLSSWIYKTSPHTSEHQITLEADSWYREINLYNLGEFGRHLDKGFEEDEKVLLEFFNKIQKFLKEVGISLSFDKVVKE